MPFAVKSHRKGGDLNIESHDRVQQSNIIHTRLHMAAEVEAASKSILRDPDRTGVLKIHGRAL